MNPLMNPQAVSLQGNRLSVTHIIQRMMKMMVLIKHACCFTLEENDTRGWAMHTHTESSVKHTAGLLFRA